jgi:rod shape-determining protein MreD
MRWFSFAALILTAAILQAALPAGWAIKPDLLIISMVFFSLYYNTTEAIITAFVIGFAADLIGPVMGPAFLGFGITGTMLAYIRHVLAFQRMVFQGAVIFMVTILTGIIISWLSFIKQGQDLYTFRTLFLTALISAVLGPVLFMPMALLMRTKSFSLRR